MEKLAILAVIGIGLLVGCEESSTPLANATKNVQAAVEQVQQTAAQASGVSKGSVELTLDSPLRVELCYARFTPKGTGRPAVLQLMTHVDEKKEEEFPSVLLWATGDAASASELVGQTIDGQLFVQREAGDGTWSSSALVPLKIRVVQADMLSVTCEIADADMAQADGEGVVKASGKLVALWAGKNASPASTK